MKRSLLAASLVLWAGLAGAKTDPRANFKQDEQWLLDVALSKSGQKAAFDAEWAQAEGAGKEAQEEFTRRWRKEAVIIANWFKTRLETTDINPNAESVQKMVDSTEFNVTNYWLARQTPEMQSSVRKKVDDANAVLGYFRGKVEAGVRESRKDFAQTLSQYVGTEEAKDAMAYRPAPAKGPVSKTPSKAIDEAKQAEQDGKAAKGGTPNDAKGKSGDTFAGGTGGNDSVVIPSAPGEEAWKTWKPGGDLSVNLGGGLGAGDLQIEPPPNPLIDSNPKEKGSAFGVLFKKFGPTAIGIGAGAILGFLLGGPIGAVVGAFALGAAGYYIGNLIDK